MQRKIFVSRPLKGRIHIAILHEDGEVHWWAQPALGGADYVVDAHRVPDSVRKEAAQHFAGRTP